MPETLIPHGNVLMANLWQTLQCLQKLHLVIARKYQLNVAEWHCVCALYHQDHQATSDLARTIGWVPTAFTPIIDRLEAKGWIMRVPDVQDRRVVRLALTALAHEHRSHILKDTAAVQKVIRTKLNASDYQTLLDMLKALQTLALE